MISGASDEELDIAIDRADLLLEIQELKKENKRLNAILELYKGTLHENNQLVHMLNDFEEWLINNYYLDVLDIATNSQVKEIYDKLQELRGGVK